MNSRGFVYVRRNHPTQNYTAKVTKWAINYERPVRTEFNEGFHSKWVAETNYLLLHCVSVNFINVSLPFHNYFSLSKHG